MYNTSEVGEVSNSNSIVESISRRRATKRVAKVAEWVKGLATRMAGTSQEEEIEYLPKASIPGWCIGRILQLLDEVNKSARGKRFVVALSEDDTFVAYAQSSIFSDSEQWFRELFLLTGNAESKFSKVSQGIMADLFVFLHKSIQASSNNIASSYHHHVLKYLQRGDRHTGQSLKVA